jgi:hypothetical protein
MVELSGNSLGLGELMNVEYPRRGEPLCPPGVPGVSTRIYMHIRLTLE